MSEKVELTEKQKADIEATVQKTMERMMFVIESSLVHLITSATIKLSQEIYNAELKLNE